MAEHRVNPTALQVGAVGLGQDRPADDERGSKVVRRGDEFVDIRRQLPRMNRHPDHLRVLAFHSPAKRRGVLCFPR